MSILLLLPSMVMAEVLINEVLYNPDGSDGPSEWIEICNNGEDDVDISAWEIQVAGISWSESYTFDSGTMITAGAYLAFGPALDSTTDFSPDLPNGGSPTDGIRLLQADGTVLDSVLYGSPNDNILLDDLGSTAGPFSNGAGSGKALARHTDCTDVSNNGTDFVETDTLTPGDVNVVPLVTICENEVFSGVVINELIYDPSGTDGGHEWIELYNTTEDAVDVSGWGVQTGTSSFLTKGVFSSGTVIASGGYLLIGEEEVEIALGIVPDLVTSLGMGNGSSSIDGVRLIDCDSVTLDTVLYGVSTDDDGNFDPDTVGSWEDDNGVSPTSFAPKVVGGQSISRSPNGVDSDQSGIDFQTTVNPSPKAENILPVVEVCENTVTSGIIINEILYDPSGTDGGHEWIELYNTMEDVVDVSGWGIQAGVSSFSTKGVFLSGTVIPSGGYLLIGEEEVEIDLGIAPDLVTSLGMGNGSSSIDGVRLIDCDSVTLDTVLYGVSTDDDGNFDPDTVGSWEDDNGADPISFAPKVGSNGSAIARSPNGVDSDQSGIDFMISAVNTPKAENPEVLCGEGGFVIKINEIFPNPDGSDGGQEFIELYNAGSETIRMDAWTIEAGTGSWSSKATIPPGEEIAPGEFYVIGESEVPSEFANLILDSNLSLGNASSGLVGVRLVNCLGGIEDTLLYGESGGETEVEEDDELADDQGALSYAIMSDSGTTIGRFPDGGDSDDNSEDFYTHMEPSPGSANIESGGTETGPEEPKEEGCRKSSQEPTVGSEPSKCSYVGSLPVMMWFASFVVLWRRQE